MQIKECYKDNGNADIKECYKDNDNADISKNVIRTMTMQIYQRML